MKRSVMMTGNAAISRKDFPKGAFFSQVLLKVSSLVLVILVSFFGGYFLNSIQLSKHKETAIKTSSIEQRSVYDFKTQLLRSIKAENLEKISR